MVKSGQLTNIVDSVSTTNQQNLSTIKNVDLRKSHPHQQNWSIVQIVDSLLDPNQQSVSLKIGETTKCTLGFFLHNNKFVDQQSGSNVQIVVSGPTSTNCVIPNLPRGSRQLYPARCCYQSIRCKWLQSRSHLFINVTTGERSREGGNLTSPIVWNAH